MDSMSACRLYLITPPAIPDPEAFADLLADAIAGADLAVLQIRLKDISDAELRRIARRIIPIGHQAGAAVLINDRPDLAAELGADGVHIGQSDASCAQARSILGPDRVIGVTCHDSRHLAMEAGEAGADYVAFGAFFPTATKTAATTASPELLGWWSELFEIPCVAIGGITIDTCAELARAGADFVAVSAGIWSHPLGPKAAIAAFNARLAEVEKESTPAR